MRTLIGVAVLALAGAALVADDKKEKDKKDPIDGKKLIGKWEPEKPKKGELASIEFTAAGKLIAIADVGGKDAKAEGTYKLDGDKLTFEITFMGETVKETITITKLTDDELEGRDKEGKAEAFKKAKPK
jgi:uncharacterized protein (TIGR03066 family)